MKTCKVQVYRLWPTGLWYDLIEVEVDAEPYMVEVIEARAIMAEWMRIRRNNLNKPIQIGLYMPSFKPKGIET